MGMTDSSTGTETEVSWQKRMSTEIKLDPGHHPLDVHLKTEILPPCSEFIMESKSVLEEKEMNGKMEVKQEPCLLEETLGKMKSESEVTDGSGIHIKTQPASFASDLALPSNSYVHRDHKIDIKIEIKEEPVYLEMTRKGNSEPEEINHKDVDLHLDTQDNTLEEDEFILPNSSRLDAVITAGKVKSALKLRENSSPWHEKDNTIAKHECDITGTFHLYKKVSHKCEICEKCFSLVSDLQTHKVAVHKGESLFKCRKCDKSFTQLSNLRVHNLIHEGKRPFKCDKCNKSFIIAQHLKMHNSITHEGKRQFKCNRCGKSFTMAQNLKTHKLIHEGKKPIKCEKCVKVFAVAQRLRTHDLIHEGLRPFECDKCIKPLLAQTI